MKLKAGTLSLQWINKKRKDGRQKGHRERGAKLAATLNGVDLVVEEAKKATEEEMQRLSSKVSQNADIKYLPQQKAHSSEGTILTNEERIDALRAKFIRASRVKGGDISDYLDNLSFC